MFSHTISDRVAFAALFFCLAHLLYVKFCCKPMAVSGDSNEIVPI